MSGEGGAVVDDCPAAQVNGQGETSATMDAVAAEAGAAEATDVTGMEVAGDPMADLASAANMGKFYRVKIIGPGPNDVIEHEIVAGVRGVEVLELISNSPELVTRPRVGLYIDGVSQSTLADITQSFKEDETTVIEVRPEPFSYLDVIHHVRLCVEMMLPDLANTAARGGGLLKLVLRLPNGSTLDEFSLQGLASGKDLLASRSNELLQSPMFSTPLDKWVPGLGLLEDLYKKHKIQPSIKDLSLSKWNPPTMRARMQGDLLYLRVMTLEGNVVHVTASSSGFFLSKSTDEVFDPLPASEPYNCHSLNGCLKKISPQFKVQFEAACRTVPSPALLNRQSISLTIPPWAASEVDNKHQSILSSFEFKQGGAMEARATTNWEITGLCQKALEQYHEDPNNADMIFFGLYLQFLMLVVEGSQLMVEGSVNEVCPLSGLWGNIVFTSVETDCESFELEGGEAAAFASARLEVRGQELVWNVLRKNKQDKRVLPMAPQVCVDYRGHRLVAQTLIPGLLDHDFGDDFHKFVLHGFTKTKDTQTLSWSQEAYDTLHKLHEEMMSKPHKLYDQNDEIHEFNMSSFVKSMAGSDNRKYFFEFTRCCPVDANFVDIEEDGNEDAEKMKSHVPKMPHKLFFLRPELVTDFMTCRRWAFLKVAYNLFDEENSEALKAKQAAGSADNVVQTQGETSHSDGTCDSSSRSADSGNGSGDTEMSESVRSLVQDLNTGVSRDANDFLSRNHHASQTMDGKIFSTMVAAMADNMPYRSGADGSDADLKRSEDFSQRIIKKAARLAGSYDENEYRIGFNLDIGNPYAKHAGDEESLMADKQMVKAASLFLTKTVLLKLVIDVTQLLFSAIDTTSLRDCMHKRGVNMRYLGNLVTCVGERPELWYVKKLCISDIIMRSAKHIARQYLRRIPNPAYPFAMSHFLNCFLSNASNIKAPKAPGVFSHSASQQSRKAKKKRKNQPSHPVSAGANGATAAGGKGSPGATAVNATDDSEEYVWQELTPKKLWTAIVEEAQSYYRYTLECDSSVSACSTYGLQHVSLLRGFCLMMGLQIQTRNYHFTSPFESTFSPNDVLNTYPVLKFPWFEPASVEEKWALLQDIGEPSLRKHILLDIMQVYNRTVGLIHPQLAKANSALAGVMLDEGDYASAIYHQEEAVRIYEITCGIDHHQTIDAYTVLARYLFACNQTTLALQAAAHARSLLLLVFGPDHPMEMAIDRDIGDYLMAGDPEMALKFLLRSCHLYERYERSDRAADLGHAGVQHRVAQCYSALGDLRSSLQAERLVYNTYRSRLGDAHPVTKHCAALLKIITTHAVKAEKMLQSSIPARQVNSAEAEERRELLELFTKFNDSEGASQPSSVSAAQCLEASLEAAKKRRGGAVNGGMNQTTAGVAMTMNGTEQASAVKSTKSKKKNKKSKGQSS